MHPPAPDRVVADGFHFYRGGEKWLAKGVTYGPFEPGCSEDCYPAADVLEEDFRLMAECGINLIRLYDLPDDRVADCAERHGIQLLIDVPWPKHLDVYTDAKLRQMCLAMVDEGVRRAAAWNCTMGMLLGNEIPADIVRWHGSEKVENLVHEMYRHAKAIAPHLLIGFANYPSTEYLELEFLDFIGFNIYLDDPKALREYLVRLRHLYPDKPVILSECGLDSRGSGIDAQAQLLPEYICSGYEAGLAGVMVFAWTDKWFTGGKEIHEWDFGLVDRSRHPKQAYHAVKACFDVAPQCRRMETPISLVIATYNGGRTLKQCLEAVSRLRYENYETIVVDDGSTDNTAQILAGFPWVRVISQENLGLSAARNAGIAAATGEIVVFTDSDCIVDFDWLYFIAHFLEQNPEMAGVGGPNITPYANSISQRAIALAPGHATHVLISHTEAEHVPGCNMAFRKSALEHVNGFDPMYRKAGDDVDVIWRLQDCGYSVGFSTAAFVWHHRRPSVKGYLKQQAGYGEAETLLLKKHSHRFTDTGQSVWRGIIYPTHSMRSLSGAKRVRYGVFGTAGYQCIYHAPPAMWFYYVTSLEWWIFSLGLLLAGLVSPLAFAAGLAAVALSLGVAARAAVNSFPSSSRYPAAAFPLVWFLWVVQPLVRGGARYWHRLKVLPRRSASTPERRTTPAFKATRPVTQFWCETGGLWRAGLIERISTEMQARQWICAPNNIWENWDLSVVLSSWFRVRLVSVEECMGGKKRLLKLRCKLVPSTLLYIFIIGGLAACLLIALYDTILARWVLTGCLLMLLWAYRYAVRGRAEVWQLAEEVITREGYWPVTGVQENAEQVLTPMPLDGLSEKREV